jgi:hypothetical protein
VIRVVEGAQLLMEIYGSSECGDDDERMPQLLFILACTFRSFGNDGVLPELISRQIPRVWTDSNRV